MQLISAAILFILYTGIFIGILYYACSHNKLQMDGRLAIISFVLRIAMGCFYGLLNAKIYGGDDTWHYHELSLEETRWLLDDPVEYLKNAFRIEHYVQQYEMTHAFESIQYGSFIKILSVFNVFTGGSYYVNVVLFNMITFWGGYYFYLFFKDIFKTDNYILRGILFFFLPLVFWTSGIRKDGMLFLSLGLYLYAFHQYLTTPRSKYILLCVLAIIVLLLNRSLLILTLLPASLAWFLSIKTTWKPYKLQLLTTAVVIILYFLLPIELLTIIVRKNNEFHLLNGGSRMELPELAPSFQSFLQTFPHAFINVFLKPLPFQFKSPLIFLSGIETLIVISSVMMAIIFPKSVNRNRYTESALMAVLTICLINYLIIGFLVPFMGAVIRYRIVFEMLILTICLMSTDWQKTRNYILK